MLDLASRDICLKSKTSCFVVEKIALSMAKDSFFKGKTCSVLNKLTKIEFNLWEEM